MDRGKGEEEIEGERKTVPSFLPWNILKPKSVDQNRRRGKYLNNKQFHQMYYKLREAIFPGEAGRETGRIGSR